MSAAYAWPDDRHPAGQVSLAQPTRTPTPPGHAARSAGCLGACVHQLWHERRERLGGGGDPTSASVGFPTVCERDCQSARDNLRTRLPRALGRTHRPAGSRKGGRLAGATRRDRSKRSGRGTQGAGTLAARPARARAREPYRAHVRRIWQRQRDRSGEHATEEPRRAHDRHCHRCRGGGLRIRRHAVCHHRSPSLRPLGRALARRLRQPRA